MGEYYIGCPDELYHYGVKGMKWGVRHDPERSGNGRSRSGMSTAKKVAIGVGVAAAVAGATYVGVKAYQTNKYNKAAKAAVQRAMRSANRASKSGNNLFKDAKGHYKVKAGYGARGFKIGSENSFTKATSGSIQRRHQLTGHSDRRTKAGAAAYRGSFYSKKAAYTPITSDYMTNAKSPRRIYEAKANSAWEQMGDIQRRQIASTGYTGKIYKFDNINKLTRKKKVFG